MVRRAHDPDRQDVGDVAPPADPGDFIPFVQAGSFTRRVPLRHKRTIARETSSDSLGSENDDDSAKDPQT